MQRETEERRKAEEMNKKLKEKARSLELSAREAAEGNLKNDSVAWCFVVILYGMVWYGMVWYGMVWYGMVWYGMVWYGMVWYGMVWRGVVWCGVV